MKRCEFCIHSEICDWYVDDMIAAPIYYCRKHKKICKESCDDFYSYTDEKEKKIRNED